MWIALSLPSIARAEPLVDEGQRLYEEADFVGALDALSRAEAETALTYEDLLELFETRAVVHLAMGNEQAMRSDLERLLALDPDHRLPPSAHPDVQRALAEVRARSRGRPRLVASTSSSSSGITVEVHVENDWANLVREVRIHGRAEPEERFDNAADAPLLIPISSGGVALYYAEAIGPGGVVVARSGSADEPLRASASGNQLEPWPFIVAGAGALLVGGAIALAVIFWPPNPPVATQPSTPMVQF